MKLPSLSERFLAHVYRRADGCLHCDLAPSNGYPYMWAYGKLRKVAAVAWFLHYGEWPAPGMHLDHICHDPRVCDGGAHDPHRLCVEWSHLKLATQAENKSSERSACGRVNRARILSRTTCPHGHEWTPENTYLDTRGRRCCMECGRIRQRAYRIRRLAKIKAAKEVNAIQ